MPSVRNMKKTIVVDSDNLICKNCGVKTAVNWQHFYQQTNQFMKNHQDCQHGDDVLTLSKIAVILGLSEKNFKNFSNKINMPAPLPFQRGYGRKQIYKREEIEKWLKENDIRKLISSIRANEYRAKKPDAKPYVPKPQVSRAIKKAPEPKPLSLMQRFIRGEFATSHQQIERRAKIEAAKTNRPARVVLACFEDKDGDFFREFV